MPELWIVDGRGESLRFVIHTLRDGHYHPLEPDAGGWTRSPILGRSFRLVRWSEPPFPWRYRLEHRA